MRAIINDGCIGCGMCVSTCEEVFVMNEEGFAIVYGELTKDNIEDSKEAADNCPVNVIIIEE